MRSLILATATRYLMPLLLLFSVFLLLRGHNEPGGGFVGGLVAGCALALHAVAHGIRATRAFVPVEPVTLIALGLGLAGGSGMLAWLWEAPFLTGLWLGFVVPGVGKLGTPLLFDVGVYVLVIGVLAKVFFVLWEE